jgi:F-type H+-transporting ATPase subunit delta
MKTTAKQYARSLYEAVENKTQAEQKEIVGRFLAMLQAEGKMSQAGKIVGELEALALEEQGIIRAEVVSARKLSETSLQELIKMVKEKTECQEVLMEEKIDPEILGGAVVRYQDKIINFSFKHFLSKMKQNLIK